ISAELINAIDAVLLSHDHHADNLDAAGRLAAATASRIVTTVAGAGRLGGRAKGLEPWQSVALQAPHQPQLRITATPCRHGPAGGDRGPVIGFMLTCDDRAIYISGDTVWYEGVEEVSRRFKPDLVVLFMGAARVAQAGPSHLTMTAEDGVAAARAFPQATIVPVHYEGWRHFSESRADIDKGFDAAGLADRLHWLQPGIPEDL
ncbi:MAG TPA: MBL fold metallo-hydrolase, partial [Gemmatimonadales bacterium]|nr:MBL fold metallo-hydrolase [Gemmatimonadales bacterium]